MLNRQIMLLGIFCVLFSSVVFGQEQSDSHIVTVTKKIDIVELSENVEKLSTSVGTFNTTVRTLNKTIADLNKTVADLSGKFQRLDERTSMIVNLLYIIIAGVFIPLLARLVQPFWRKKDSNSENTVESTNIKNEESRSIEIEMIQIDTKDRFSPTLTASSHLRPDFDRAEGGT